MGAVEVSAITAPEEDLDSSLLDLRALCRACGAEALLPVDDASLWLCRRAQDAAWPVLVGPGASQTEVALDKRLQGPAAASAGFAVPPTRMFEAGGGPSREIDIRFPVVVKPAMAAMERAGRLVLAGAALTCDNGQELAEAIAGPAPGTPLMAQPRLEGTGEGVFGLATPSGVRAWSAHRRIRMMNPAGSGSSACVSIPLEDSIREPAERMMKDLDWSGIFMIEMLRDAEGQPWFIELNGRAWGSMALSRAAALEYPTWAVSQALGDEPAGLPASAPPAGVRARHVGREVIHLAAVLRGPKSGGVKWPSRARTVREVLSWRRGDRAYNWRRGELPVFLDDTVSTILSAVRRKRRSET